MPAVAPPTFLFLLHTLADLIVLFLDRTDLGDVDYVFLLRMTHKAYIQLKEELKSSF